MNKYQITCNPQRIGQFLDKKLSDAELTDFESHLSNCEDCRQRLESAVASEEIWSEVRESLRDVRLAADDPRGDNSALDSAGEEVANAPATILKLLAPTDDDRMIGRWGTYEVVGVVGTGGMGVVLKAFDAALNRYVAIKILAPHLGTSGAAIRRFSREGKAAAAVVHDNVIEIYHVAESAGLPYLVMPYVRGPSLQRRVNDEGSLAVVEILRVGMQAAAGLAAAHAQGLVHRDVKPANILLADGIERVKLTDFGLARAADDASLTKTGVIAGTPQYMSPEQARGEPVDPRSDLFSLGSVLYAMCTGRPPFRAETSYGVLRRITDEEPRPIREINPDIPDWLCGIVGKLMAKRPDDRFQSASEVATLLELCLAHVQQPTVVPPPTSVSITSVGARKPRLFAGWSGRKRILAALIGLLLFGGPALGIIIHLKKDGKTTTVEVPEGSTARVDAQGALTVELPSSPDSAITDGGKRTQSESETQDRSRSRVPVSSSAPSPAGQLSTTPVSIFARGDEEAQRNVEKALRQPVSIEFDNKKLSDVAQYLKEAMNKRGCPIEIQLDLRALKKAGIGPDLKITKTLRGASLGTALRVILEDLKLAFAIRNGVLLITSTENDEDSVSGNGCLETKLYPVTDLVTAGPDGTVAAGPLVDILLDAVAPKSWIDNGGNGAMSVMIVKDRLLLVVSQTPEGHEALERTLTSLRKAAGLNTDALPSARDPLAGGDAAASAKPGAAKSGVAQAMPAAPNDEAAERTIREALDQPVSLQITKMKLKDAVDYVKSYLGTKGYHVEIQLDLPALKDEGIDPNKQLAPKSVAGISLRSALRLLLDDVELRYVIHNGMLVITTPVEAESDKYQETRFYRVWDLIVNGDGIADFGPLTEFLTGVAESKSWIDNGGNGTISDDPAHGLLVISQSEQEHEAVEDCLDALRRAAGLKGDLPTPGLPHIHFRPPNPATKDPKAGKLPGAVLPSPPGANAPHLPGSKVPQSQNPADLFQARWESLRNVAPPENRGRPMNMSPEEIARFARLPEEQQKAAMIEGIKRIQRACGNVSLSTTTCISKVGDPRKSDGEGVTLLSYGEFGTSVYDLRRIGASYRVEATDWSLSRQNRKPRVEVRNYDAESGISRYLFPQRRADGSEQNHARIEKEPPRDLGPECSYAYYLGGFKPLWDDYYKVLIDHQSALRVRGVNKSSRLVEVSFAYTDERRKETVSGTAWFDLGKNWMLRKMKQEAKCVGPPRDRETYELFSASDSELIDGVWMPTKVSEFVWASDDKPRKTDDPFSSSKDVSSETSFGNLRETIAENIKLGSVKKEELAVVFPAGAVVEDCITGDRWTVGKEKTSETSPPHEAISAENRSGAVSSLFGGTSIPAANLTKMEEAFGKAGLNGFTIEGGQVKVPRAQRAAYLAALTDAHALPPNFNQAEKEAADGELFEPPGQHAYHLRIQKEEELALVIRNMRGIERASVILDSQTKPGLGIPTLKTASVAAQAVGGVPLNDDQVDSIRYLVVAAIAGMKPENVTVADANGRVHVGTDPAASGSDGDPYSREVRNAEQALNSKVRAALSYIPNVTVTSTVTFDHEKNDRGAGVKNDPKPAPMKSSEKTRDLTPRLAKVSIGIPAGNYEKVWRARNPAKESNEANKPDLAALDKIREEVSQDVCASVAKLLPSGLDVKDPTTLVTVTTFQDVKQFPAKSAAGSLAFGPVIERTLCPKDLEHDAYLNLDTGKLFDAPDPHKVKGGSVASHAEIWKWAATKGIDLSFGNYSRSTSSADSLPAIGSDINYLTAIDISFGACDKLGKDDWDHPPPDRILQWFEVAPSATTGVSYYIGFRKNEVMWFKMRKGTVGLLQFLGYADPSNHSRGVNIRYKLVEHKAEQKKPSTLAPTSGGEASHGNDLDRLYARWEARKKAIITATVEARHFSNGESGVNHLLTPKDVQAIVRQYERAKAPKEALRSLIIALRSKSSHDDPPWGEVWLATDGKRTSELSSYRFIKDGRADVIASRNPVMVYKAGGCGYATLKLVDFASEFGAPDKVAARVVRHADGATTLQEVASDREFEMEVDDKTAIIRHSAWLTKGQLWCEHYQLGELRCTGHIIFPAVVVRVNYDRGRLTSADVLSPTSIVVNRPLPEDTFTVAESKGSQVLDFRHSKDPQQVTISEDVPDVVAYLMKRDGANLSKPPFEAQLLSGVTVELLGISENPSKDKPWWRPDGSPLDKRPYESLGKTMTIESGDISREVAVLLKHLSTGAVSTGVELRPTPLVSHTDAPKCLLLEEGEPVPGTTRAFRTVRRELHALAGIWPVKTESVSVRVIVSAGAWKTFAEGGEPGTSSATGSDKGHVTFASAYATDGGVAVNVTYDLHDQEVRVVAVTKDGKEHLTDDFNGAGFRNVMQATVTFPKVLLRDIRIFRFQTRPYEWVEFRGVSLHAGQKTSVQIIAPTATPAEEKASGTVSEAVSDAVSTPANREADVSQDSGDEKDLIEMLRVYTAVTGGVFPKSLNFATAWRALAYKIDFPIMWETIRFQCETLAPGSAKALEAERHVFEAQALANMEEQTEIILQGKSNGEKVRELEELTLKVMIPALWEQLAPAEWKANETQKQEFERQVFKALAEKTIDADADIVGRMYKKITIPMIWYNAAPKNLRGNEKLARKFEDLIKADEEDWNSPPYEEEIRRLGGEEMLNRVKAWKARLTIKPQLEMAATKKFAKESSANSQKLVEIKPRVQRGTTFVSQLPPAADAVYAGKGVSLGTPETPIFSYRPRHSKTYRIIYADLTIRDAVTPPRTVNSQH